ncbi:hypothetical protein ACPCTN_03280 [Streptomyces cinereoruber]|uniref:hypothetical protein n=1 Tax=Streptomyces cinereoruber TaxID=67260 RepID=UPI003C2E793D
MSTGPAGGNMPQLIAWPPKSQGDRGGKFPALTSYDFAQLPTTAPADGRTPQLIPWRSTYDLDITLKVPTFNFRTFRGWSDFHRAKPIRIEKPTSLIGYSGVGKAEAFLRLAMFAFNTADDLANQKRSRAFQQPSRPPVSLRAGREISTLDRNEPQSLPSVKSDLITGATSVRTDSGELYSAEQLARLEDAWRAVAQMALLALAALLGVRPAPRGRLPIYRGSAPCGVARLAATVVPRAPGKGFMPPAEPLSRPA